MTRIWYMSDLHLDVGSDHRLPTYTPEHDVLVVAGDASERLSKRALRLVHYLFGAKSPCIVYVPGNHCFWKSALPKEKDRARIAARAYGIHLLMDGESLVVGDLRIVGATLWTDYRIAGHPELAKNQGERTMRDFKRIRDGDGEKRLTATRLAGEHALHRAAITAALETPFSGRTLVVTHHPPHPACLQHGEPRDLIDASYASDLRDLMHFEGAPDAWIHGHVHENRDFVEGKTRILANPHGYSWRRGHGKRAFIERDNEAFDPHKVVEL